MSDIVQFPGAARDQGRRRSGDGAQAPSPVSVNLAGLSHTQVRKLCIHALRHLLDHAQAGAACGEEIAELALMLDTAPPGPEAA